MIWIRKYGMWLIVLIALGHQVLQKVMGIHHPFLASYLDDVLCMPIFLSLWNWERKNFWRWDRLDKIDIIYFTLLVFLLFEFILPLFVSSCTSDWWDGLAYAAGSSLYWWIWR